MTGRSRMSETTIAPERVEVEIEAPAEPVVGPVSRSRGRRTGGCSRARPFSSTTSSCRTTASAHSVRSPYAQRDDQVGRRRGGVRHFLRFFYGTLTGDESRR